METLETYTGPLDVRVDAWASDHRQAGECGGCLQVFPDKDHELFQRGDRSTGYGICVGQDGAFFSAHADGRSLGEHEIPRSEMKTGPTWHELRVRVLENEVRMYLNGRMWFAESGHKRKEGVIRIGRNCRKFIFANAMVATWPAGTTPPSAEEDGRVTDLLGAAFGR